ncbi:predicted protein [Plenodomus lingam JN3]|uniref:Predicted protein n=1 Tax=Leptosphaeria maculans (strain JN3 / isolate v23.1.3 / race Av1-4-5-6-7-8) TaxID=985895 RepID=E5A5G8_LEPMJ|nr:predicted protein [Plenodomus lingam JN3]CBX98866.1 predicted protein [Plenodomus lingam JN3]
MKNVDLKRVRTSVLLAEKVQKGKQHGESAHINTEISNIENTQFATNIRLHTLKNRPCLSTEKTDIWGIGNVTANLVCNTIFEREPLREDKFLLWDRRTQPNSIKYLRELLEMARSSVLPERALVHYEIITTGCGTEI